MPFSLSVILTVTACIAYDTLHMEGVITDRDIKYSTLTTDPQIEEIRKFIISAKDGVFYWRLFAYLFLYLFVR